ncbi:hypothetical protein Ciccas_007052 [Cichlidogyrus casuarinus]|uniref:Uncharacterized protein n=1 Tax=Cichlidogyrus casuarinus TaxID=1844966 RepID=A0ABD2Q7X8_9PLAT
MNELQSGSWVCVMFEEPQEEGKIEEIISVMYDYVSRGRTSVYVILKDSPFQNENCFELCLASEDDLRIITENKLTNLREPPIGPILVSEGETFEAHFSGNIKLIKENDSNSVKVSEDHSYFQFTFRRHFKNIFPFEVTKTNVLANIYLYHYRGFMKVKSQDMKESDEISTFLIKLLKSAEKET